MRRAYHSVKISVLDGGGAVVRRVAALVARVWWSISEDLEEVGGKRGGGRGWKIEGCRRKDRSFSSEGGG